MELVGLCPPNSSAFLFVLMSDEKTGAQRQVTFWILKLESGQVQVCPEVCLMPVEQALLPPLFYLPLAPRFFRFLCGPCRENGSLLRSKLLQRLGIKAGYQLAVPRCLRPVPPKYSSDHTSFLGEGLAWTSELQGGCGGERESLAGIPGS